MVAAVKGYKLVLVMPESMSLERRRLMLAYGATFDLTPARKGHEGRDRARASSWSTQTPGAWMPQQFENPANIDVHVRTTAQEILADFADTPIDVLITGVGTGGHITGVAEVLKKTLAEPEGLRGRADAVAGHLAAASPARTRSRASAPASSPRNLHTQLLDGVIQVDAGDAKDMARRAAREEGMLVGISSGATLAAIAQKLPDLPDGARVLGFNYDTGERYLSVPDFLPES